MNATALRFGFGRRLPIVLQAEAAECGLACLAMVLGYHGRPIDLATFRQRHAVSLKGTTLRTLIQIGETVGLTARPLRLDIEALGQLQRPCILHWGMNHFVVLAEVGRSGIVIHDPARGRRSVALDEVSREFTGVALETIPTRDFTRRDERSGLRLRDLFRHIAGLRPALLRIGLLSLGVEVAALMLPVGSQVIIDEAIVSADHDLLLTVTMGLGLLLLLQLLINTARSWAIMLIGTTVSLQWYSSLFDHLSRLSLEYFEKRNVGDILSRFGSLAIIQKTLTTGFVQALLDGVMSIGMVGMLFLYGGWLGWIALIATALDLGLRLVMFRSYRESSEEAIIHDARQQTHLIETIRGAASVRLLGLRERRRAAWLNHLVDSLNARLRLQRLDIVFSRANELIFGLDRIVMLALGARAVMHDQMSVGMLVAFLTYKDQLSIRAGSLINGWFELRMLDVQTSRLSDITQAEPEPRATVASALRPPGGRHPEGREPDGLRGEELALRYGAQDPWVWRGLSLHITPGQSVAIVGPSGCGKTTLLKVLMGLIPPQEGSIRLDGVDIRSLGLDAYRSRISGVLQDDGLFAGSISENIAGFDEHPDQAWIEDCAFRAAIIDDIVRMPMRFETLVGDMGSALSGGQKQRIVLARALYRRPEILFLDEATSHLDDANEALVAGALQDLNITRIIVAHRPATIARADMVLQMEPNAPVPLRSLAG
ncbi:peptidase domain-containing ABC transporter [Lichenicoccus sp.]|uniref:peptidase domain-containing ABC transporter n=1 Tax=Lichenicoccus sp. TaxID=2781899 RepID=UPI003D1178E3